MDVPAPGIGAVCGPCPLGYAEVSQKCYGRVRSRILFVVNKFVSFSDIDECTINSTICEQLCINTDGSYTCACNDGYQLITGSNLCQGMSVYCSLMSTFYSHA